MHQWNRNKECLAAARNAPSELRFNHSVANKYCGIVGQACEREGKSASIPTPFRVDSDDACSGGLTRALQGGCFFLVKMNVRDECGDVSSLGISIRWRHLGETQVMARMLRVTEAYRG